MDPRSSFLVQACKKKDYSGKIYEKNDYYLAPQIKSQYSFDGNWWYIWLRKGVSTDKINVGDIVTTDKTYTVKDIHFYKNYKRGSILLSD